MSENIESSPHPPNQMSGATGGDEHALASSRSPLSDSGGRRLPAAGYGSFDAAPRLDRLVRLVALLDDVAARLQLTRTASEVPEVVGSALREVGIESQIALLDAPLSDGEVDPLAAANALRIAYISTVPGLLKKAEEIMGRSVIGLPVPTNRIPAFAEALRTRQPRFLADTREAISAALPWVPDLALRQLARMAHARTSIVAPLLSRGRTLGIMSVWADDLVREDTTALGALARQAGIALDNARLHRSMREAQLRAEVAADALAQQAGELRRLERQKDEFLGIASHELKTPLTSLKMLVQMSARRARQAGEPEPTLPARMELAVARMERLIGDLLDVSRIEAGRLALRMERVDLVELCHQTLDDQRIAADRSVHDELAEGQIFARVDADRIIQVMTNLLLNALKYSAPLCPVALRLRRDAGRVVISVRDEGAGIPAEALPHLFERFYRVPGVEVQSGSGVGLGIGLYISRRIVEQHGGQMGVESAIGGGSTFWFSLPAED
ncbi:MAG: sensor histidine kinase [Ktedonobacterales bacterium]